MANVRIRYGKVSETLLASRRVFTTASGNQVKAELDTANKRYVIRDAVSGLEIASGGDTINIAVLKIKCKQALADMGVEFADENRQRS
jgi:hypothetical protein